MNSESILYGRPYAEAVQAAVEAAGGACVITGEWEDKVIIPVQPNQMTMVARAKSALATIDGQWGCPNTARHDTDGSWVITLG